MFGSLSNTEELKKRLFAQWENFVFWGKRCVELMRTSVLVFVDFISQHCIQFKTQKERRKKEKWGNETFPFNNVF